MKRKTFISQAYIVTFLILFILSASGIAYAQIKTFTNPIVRSRDAADPWLIYKDGYYYFTFTTGGSIQVWKSRIITGLDAGMKATVWTPPAKGPQSRDIWAPELHFLAGKWYIYYAADDGDNAHHRLYVLESKTSDPQGQYIDKGRIYDPQTDRWAIDATVLQKADNSLYLVWSGWEGFVDKVAQNLYIAPMSNPWTISGSRALISRPDHSWEGWINEGPEVLQRDGKIFIVYSANGSWTPDYCLGLLMNTDGDVMNPQSWRKSNVPLLARAPEVYGPGHNTFAKSPDGAEDWIIYHATDNPTDGWRNRRPRAQKFTWNADGTPNFGYPIAPRQPLAAPSGELVAMGNVNNGTGTGLSAEYYDNQNFTDLKLRRTDATINFAWGVIGDSDAPDPSMHPHTYSVRWQGSVEPRYSETYTFKTFTDDGVRLWIDDKLIINNWTNHQPTLNKGTINLMAGQRYHIRLDYYENMGAAIARLEWTSHRQPLEVVPQSQLYPSIATTNVDSFSK
jgi:GH43 family beta-xylosidase